MRLKLSIATCTIFCATSLFASALKIENPKAGSLNLNWLNTTILPQNDFYTFANGTWQKNNPIPKDRATWGSFHILNEKVQHIIHQMLIEAADNKHARPESIEQKVGDFYFSGMDEQAIEQAGIKPLQAELAQIDHIKTLDDLQRAIAHLHQIGAGSLFNFGSMQDFENSKEMIGAAMQGGLGLPDRDYYLKDDKKFKHIREVYLKHVAEVFRLLGYTESQSTHNAAIIMSIETQLAKASLSQVEQRDPHAVYHIMNIVKLNEVTPHFSWKQYFELIGQNKLNHINLGMPEFFKTMDALLTTVSIDDWRVYLRWNLIDSFDSYLSKSFVDEGFKMTQVLSGTEQLLPRWKRVVTSENSALGFAIGKLYVARYFSETSKQEVLNIIKNIRVQLRADIATLPWMSPKTRQFAIKKLDLMEERVGFPNKWWDYSSLKIDRGPYVLNVMRTNEFLIKRDLNKIGKPVDRDEWAMTPQTINAYYDPSMNSLNIPAGILQPPFFDPNAPDAVNYGAIGFVIGHEMTHGFDDQGAQFDAYGNLKDWWTPADLSRFKMATECIVNQFSQYVVDGDMHVQGKLVVGEAAADLGGITLAYRAYLRSSAYRNAKNIMGFTPVQQFFLGAAHVWANNIRAEQSRNQVTVDPHPPAQFRVNGSLANMPEFQAAFKIPANSTMVNQKRCVIW
jgi:putative endopeptidase